MKDYEADEEPAVYFRFDYIVSPSPEPFVKLCSRFGGASHRALMRRSWAIMRRRFAPIWIDSDFQLVTDHLRLELLKPAFRKTGTPGRQDFNLNRDRWKSASVVYDMSMWRDRCFAALERSEKLLREQSRLPAWSEECVAEAERRANHIQQQYRSRIALAVGDARVSLESEFAFEQAFLAAQIESFRNPEVRVDSVGAVFLSNQMPFSGLENEIEDED
jgi:hypothetical protein